MLPPPTDVLAAFGAPADAVRIEGGEGQSWRAGEIVLKPDGPEPVLAWQADRVEAIGDTADFRLARHVRSSDGRFVVDGWTATTWVDGAHGHERWDDVLAASRAFHTAIVAVELPPADLTWPDNQWRTADKVAWNEQPRPDDLPPDVVGLLDALHDVVAIAWEGAPAQVIHADIGGNVLFADGLPPAIIDLSLYVRPAAFADAVTVVDAVAWQGAPLPLAFRFGMTVELGEQLLARAVVFRVVAATLAWPQFPERVSANVEAYRPVLSSITT